MKKMTKKEIFESFEYEIEEFKLDRSDKILLRTYFSEFLDNLYENKHITQYQLENLCMPEHFILEAIGKERSLRGNISINSLIIELTRKCNLRCDHCCRGNAQKKSIEIKTIVKLFGFLSQISTLTISGGEPGTDEKTFLEISKYFLEHGDDIENYFLVLNGAKRYSKKFTDRCKQIQCHNQNFGEESIGGITFSFDQYHTRVMSINQLINREINYKKIGNRKHTDANAYSGKNGLIQMGRCTFGNRILEPDVIEIDNYDNQEY